MKKMKILSVVGMALCIAGILLIAVGGVAHFSPPTDPAGTGSLYDDRVENYNEQLSRFAEANPGLPAPTPAKTRLQVHYDDTMLGICAGGALTAVGLMVLYFSRAKQI